VLLLAEIGPDVLLKSIVTMLLAILLISVLLKKFNQPYFVAYIIAGILVGPWGMKVFNDPHTIAVIGEMELIITLVFRLLKETWRNSVYAGAMLSQIGEFSLVLCLVAKYLNLMDAYWYQLTLAVVSVTMLFTSLWISIIQTFIYRQSSNLRQIWFSMTDSRQ